MRCSTLPANRHVTRGERGENLSQLFGELGSGTVVAVRDFLELVNEQHERAVVAVGDRLEHAERLEQRPVGIAGGEAGAQCELDASPSSVLALTDIVSAAPLSTVSPPARTRSISRASGPRFESARCAIRSASEAVLVSSNRLSGTV